MSGNGLSQCEMCSNGLADHEESVDGDDVLLCSSCRDLLVDGGRIEPEVAA